MIVKFCMRNLHVIWKISTEKKFGKSKKKIFAIFFEIFLKFSKIFSNFFFSLQIFWRNFKNKIDDIFREIMLRLLCYYCKEVAYPCVERPRIRLKNRGVQNAAGQMLPGKCCRANVAGQIMLPNQHLGFLSKKK